MAYVAVLNKPGITVSTNELVIAPEDVCHLSTVKELSEQLAGLFHSYQDKLEQQGEQGYQAGFRQGKEDGEQGVREEYAKQLTQMSVQYNQEKARLSEYAVTLALQIVRRIAEEIGPAEMMAEIAHTAIAEFSRETPMILRVHPETFASVRDRVQNAYAKSIDFQGEDRRKSAANSHNNFIQVRADESLDIYDCLVETEFGTTVAGLDHQLRCLEDVLLHEFRSTNPPLTEYSVAGDFHS